MKTKALLVAALGAASLTLSSGALAQQTPGWYVGAEVGQVDLEDAEKDTGFRFLGGYQFNRNLAAEASYNMIYDKEGVEITAWELAGVFSFPVANRLSVLGKLGFAMWEGEVEGAEGADGTDLTYGIGLQYDFSPRLGVRGMWQRYDVEGDADVLSIGVIYRF